MLMLILGVDITFGTTEYVWYEESYFISLCASPSALINKSIGFHVGIFDGGAGSMWAGSRLS